MYNTVSPIHVEGMPVTSRLDCCNSTLAGINVDQVYGLQGLFFFSIYCFIFFFIIHKSQKSQINQKMFTLQIHHYDKVIHVQKLTPFWHKIQKGLKNAAARLVTKKRKHEHISPVLFDLHWLHVSYRIKFKLCVLVYRHFEETLPPYLPSVLKTYHPQRSPRSSTDRLLVIPRVNLKSAGERFFVCLFVCFFPLRCLRWMELPP